MKVRKQGNIAILLLIGLLRVSSAQSAEVFPFVYDQFYVNPGVLNPASMDSVKLRLNLFNRSFAGLFTGVSRSFLDLDYRKDHSGKKRFSKIGFYVSNNRDGDFINRIRAYGRYSWTSAISAHTMISLGMSWGLVQYSFQSSQAGLGGSDTKVDGNTGISIWKKKWKVGISWQQFMSPSLTPISTTYLVREYVTGNFSYQVYEGFQSGINFYSLFLYQKDVPISMQAAMIWNTKDRFDAGVIFHHQNGIGFTVGLRELAINEHYRLRITSSYLLSTRKLSSSRDDVLEFTLGIGRSE